MEKRDVLKINRQFLLLTRQLAREGRAAEIMTGLPRAVIEKVASLDMDEIDELAETVPVSLYTFRLTDSALERLLQMPRDAKSTYAEATLQHGFSRIHGLRRFTRRLRECRRQVFDAEAALGCCVGLLAAEPGGHASGMARRGGADE